MGVASDVQCLRAISSWKSVYSLSLTWTRLSRWNDHPLMASKRSWCTALRKRWLSNLGAALVPSAVASLLDLFAESFFRSHFLRGQTFGKLVYMKIPIITNQSQTTLIWCECQHALYKTITLGHVLFYDTYLYTCIYTRTHKFFLVKGILWHTSMYVFDKHFHATSHIYAHFLKGSLCYLLTNIHILKGIFMLPIQHIQILKGIFCYISTHFVRHFHAIYSHTL